MKLPNGFGSVYKLSGSRRNPWAARKTTGWTYEEGKERSYPIYKFIGFYRTKAEALQALADYNKDPYDLQAESLTLEELYDQWSEQYFETVVPATVRTARAAWKLCEPIKDMKVQDIKLIHLQKIADESGKNTPTLKNFKKIISVMYKWGVINEIVPPDKHSMISHLNVKKAGNPNKIPRKTFTSEEIDDLWAEPADSFASVVLIMIFTGVRIGEITGLKKEDVHLEEQYFEIRKAKTAAGIRQVPIANKLVPLFQYWMERPCDYLICDDADNPFLEHRGYVRFTDTYWKQYSFDHKPHDTRHTCITMLTEAGVDERTIRQIVGHKGAGVTQAVYTHIPLKAKIDAVNLLLTSY